MDGSKGFIFFWNKVYRVIYEEVLKYFFDFSKKDYKFVLQKKDELVMYFKFFDWKERVMSGIVIVVFEVEFYLIIVVRVKG